MLVGGDISAHSTFLQSMEQGVLGVIQHTSGGYQFGEDAHYRDACKHFCNQTQVTHKARLNWNSEDTAIALMCGRIKLQVKPQYYPCIWAYHGMRTILFYYLEFKFSFSIYCEPISVKYAIGSSFRGTEIGVLISVQFRRAHCQIIFH